MKGIDLAIVMDHLGGSHQCFSSASETSDQSNFLLNPNHFNLESPPELSPHADNLISGSQGLLDSSPPHLSPVGNFKFRNLFPPKSRENLFCRSETSIVSDRPVVLSTRLSQSCGQLATQRRSTLTDIHQLPCSSEYLPATSITDNYSHDILAPMVTDNASILPSVPPTFRHISRSGLFCPNYFTGTSKEDPRKFVQDLKLWASFQQLDEKAMISAFQLLLRDSAAVWFKTVPKTSFTNFQELSKLFIERYTIFDKPWKEIGLLWETRQLPSQNVHDFVAGIQCKGDRLQLSSDTVFQIVLNGLLPSVKNCVLQKGVKSIEELLQSAALYQIASESLPDSNADVLKSLSELKQQVERLAINSTSSLAPIQSNTLRGAHCAGADQFLNPHLSQKQQSQVYNNRCVNFSRQPKSISTADTFGPHSSGDSRFNSQSNWRTQGRQNVFNSRRFRQQRPQQFYRHNQFNNFPTPSVVHCTKCGNLHQLNDRCPAYGLHCRICGHKNHYARLCWKAKLGSR